MTYEYTQTNKKILEMLKTATMWSCHSKETGSSRGGLTIYHDNILADTRTVSRIELRVGAKTTVETQSLHGYDNNAKRWNKFGGKTYDKIENRRGEKALRAYIANICTAECGCPSPVWFMHYSPQPGG